MPTLEWIGKEKVINHHQDVPFRVLERKYSYDESGQHDEDNGSENMIIRGDNLEALKALLPHFGEKIDCIYIDPPYNTANSTNANQRWVYNDNVDDPKIQSWLGSVVGDEGEDLSRHDKWLCMMYPRLKLLHKLLSPTGVIFVSIDNNEVCNLRFVLDEIFGRKNFITIFAVENNPKGRKNNDFVSEGYEYCFLYCKNKEKITAEYSGRVFNDIVDTSKKDSRKQLHDQWGTFNQSKRQVSGSNKSNALCATSNSQRCFTIYYNFDTDHLECLHEYNQITDEWVLSDKGKKLLEEGYTRYVCTNNETGKPSIPLYSVETLKEKHENHGIYFKTDGTVYEKERDRGQQITSFLPNKRFGVDYMTESATRMLEKIFGEKDRFNNSKNVEFIELLISLLKKENAIILDSFAGSGTTAHAVLRANSKSGNKKFILVELMDYADTTTAERVKRVIKGYGTGDDAVKGLGGNFSFYDLGETLLLPDGNLNEDVGEGKIRDYIWYTETKEPMTDTVSADEPYFLGTSRDTAYYFYYKKDEITTLDYDFLSTVQTKAAGYIIYADLCTISDEELKKWNITFKKIPRDIAKV